MTPGRWELVLRGVWVTLQRLVFGARLAAGVSGGVGGAREGRHADR